MVGGPRHVFFVATGAFSRISAEDPPADALPLCESGMLGCLQNPETNQMLLKCSGLFLQDFGRASCIEGTCTWLLSRGQPIAFLVQENGRHGSGGMILRK
ncbi:unnamed protein product [Ostreobium quekettii]|uniref:Uncharacterized protein n=1 Tax=Ostreobium quekettii TaxID=121088 RepID=A0A8S1JGA4_9CHLO|nr:unnamed protein product [Ostreobium quekettii]